MALYYPPTANGLQKTLGAQLDEGTTASVTLNNTTNIQDKAGVFVVDRVDTGGTEKAAALREYISFTGVSGSTLTGLTRGLGGGGADQDHAVGAVVEFISDVVQQDGIMDALDNLVTSTGALDTTKVVDLTTDQTLTNKTLTSPVITTPQINDTTKDHQYIFAVNELTADRTVTLPLLTGADEFVFKDHAVTMTNKTLTSPVLNTGVSGTAITDEDDMASDSATKVPTQQSVKAYVDSKTAATTTAKARAHMGSTQNITANTEATVVIDTEDFDTGSNFNTGTYKFTVPTTGIYLVTAALGFSITASGDVVGIYIRKNSANGASQVLSINGTGNVNLSVSEIVSATATDTFELRCINFNNNDTVYGGILGIHLLSV